jgi:hypothetical protein
MSSVDTAWLRMDSQANLMQIVGVYEFNGTIEYERLRRLYEERFVAPHERFRSCVVRDPTVLLGTRRQLRPRLSCRAHGVAGQGTTADLKRLVGRLASTALDPNKPLWQVHLVDNYNGGQALIVRIHHCIADGIALIGVLLAMTSENPADEDATDAYRSAKPRSASLMGRLLRPLPAATVKAIGTTGDAAARALQASAAMLGKPESIGATAGEMAHVAAQVAKDLAGIALIDDDAVTSLKGVPSGSKVVAWNDPLALDDVKAVGRALAARSTTCCSRSVAGRFARISSSRARMSTASNCARWCRSICAIRASGVISATSSDWCRCCCRSASRIDRAGLRSASAHGRTEAGLHRRAQHGHPGGRGLDAACVAEAGARLPLE